MDPEAQDRDRSQWTYLPDAGGKLSILGRNFRDASNAFLPGGDRRRIYDRFW
jgi:hypothetical protein